MNEKQSKENTVANMQVMLNYGGPLEGSYWKDRGTIKKALDAMVGQGLIKIGGVIPPNAYYYEITEDGKTALELISKLRSIKVDGKELGEYRSFVGASLNELAEYEGQLIEIKKQYPVIFEKASKAALIGGKIFQPKFKTWSVIGHEIQKDDKIPLVFKIN